ncbi:MAG: hypothetical protein CL573_03145 [Alphaproteobacteria bacterium]|nr:hypothetical protein [Alphaproteobacteria bacterium]HCP01522.1 hypothetical protein [Rhodospirillaceae bacterium]
MRTLEKVEQLETIEGSGFPIAFKYKQGVGRPEILGNGPVRDVYVTEVRTLAGYQKEGVVHEGINGSAWRMTTDEGLHIGGRDVAPFPLGFFNAGLQGDLIGRILKIAAVRDIKIDDLKLDLKNGYYVVGSFVRGDAKGYVEPSRIHVEILSSAPAAAVSALIQDAIKASPAMATMGTPVESTFAIYVNGRRRMVTSLPNSNTPDVPDPYKTYRAVPSPLDCSDELEDIIWKTGQANEGEIQPAINGTDDKVKRIVRTIAGNSILLDPDGVIEIDTVLGLPGMSHFALKTDERLDGDCAPSGLAMIAAGIAFCYLTQIERYTIHQKFNIRGARLVQYSPFTLSGDPADGSWTGDIEPVDTHLFLSGDEDGTTHEKLMKIAATVCYLHATLADSVESDVRISLNGRDV